MNTHRDNISVPMPLLASPHAGARIDRPLNRRKGMDAWKTVRASKPEVTGPIQTFDEWQFSHERRHRYQRPTTNNNSNKPKISRLKKNPRDGLMIFEKDHAQELLRRLAARVTRDKASREDLAQEAMIHLWQQELRCPRQSESWYIQSCLFHLLNCVQRGRSLDSPRRRRARGSIATLSPPADSTEVHPERDESPLPTVCANEILDLLLPKLNEREREVLRCLAEGLEPGDIARKLRVSRQAVGKQRRKIALVATRLGISPPSKSTPPPKEPGDSTESANGVEMPRRRDAVPDQLTVG
jgi:RNA polymerase sigma factor (sigma-70 family)